MAPQQLPSPKGGASDLGDWLSDGYGYCARIDAQGLKLIEITPVSAIDKFRALRDEGTVPEGGGAAFRIAGGPMQFWFVPAGEERFALQFPWAASKIVFRRVAAAPDVVGRPVADDPETNFEVFWQTFAIHYPFFALREVDWNAMRAIFRSHVSKTTSPTELFDLLRAMIEPLHDAHTSLQAPAIGRDFGGGKPDPDPLDEKDRRRALAIVDDCYVDGKLEVGCNGQLKYGRLDAKTGYLGIHSFSGYALAFDFASMRRALEETLDRAMTAFAGRERRRRCARTTAWICGTHHMRECIPYPRMLYRIVP